MPVTPAAVAVERGATVTRIAAGGPAAAALCGVDDPVFAVVGLSQTGRAPARTAPAPAVAGTPAIAWDWTGAALLAFKVMVALPVGQAGVLGFAEGTGLGRW
jgi:hypothetical protein